MLTPEQLQEKAELMELAGMLFPTAKIDDISEEYDSPIALRIDGFIILLMDDSVLIKGFDTGRKYWELGIETYDAGGYWEAPSSDYETIKTHIDGHINAMRDLAAEHAKNEINLTIQNWYENKVAPDEEIY